MYLFPPHQTDFAGGKESNERIKQPRTCHRAIHGQLQSTPGSYNQPTANRDPATFFPETVSEFVRQNADLFNGIGENLGTVHLDIDHSIRPKVFPPSRLSLTVKNPVKKKLDMMEAEKIIKKTEHPKSWVSRMLVKEKPMSQEKPLTNRKPEDDLCICIDGRQISTAINPPIFKVPLIQEYIDDLEGQQYFTVMDLRSGFWHCKLDDESSEACCFATPFGTYQCLRLPFGLNASAQIFFQKLLDIFHGIKGLRIYFDDFVIYGRTLQDAHIAK